MIPARSFGRTPAGEVVHRLRLANRRIEVDLLTWGAVVQSLRVDGVDVVLGYPTWPGYRTDDRYVGAVVGRYANRISDGRFTLDGTQHRLPRNDRGHTLHGGPEGFHRQVWTAVPTGSDRAPGVRLELHSPDGAMGFPGGLRATCHYLLRGPELLIDLQAVADRPTVVNLTQHTYFDLTDGHGTAGSHRLRVAADRFLPVGATGRPGRRPLPVAGTPFDLRRPRLLADGLAQEHPQLAAAGGYDHWLLLDDARPDRVAARLEDPVSGRALELRTDQPGIQVYTGNALDGARIGKRGPLSHRAGVCLEAQRRPDGPNHPDAGVVLRPGEEYRSRTVWRFPPAEPFTGGAGRGAAPR